MEGDPGLGLRPRPSNLLLVVDHDRAYNDRIAAYLRRLGIRVAQRFDGRAAAEAMVALRPALVLMEIDLPGLNAIAVTQRVLQEGVDPQVILMSTQDEWLDLAHASRLHFFRILGKPLPLRVLGNFLGQCLVPLPSRAA